MRSRPRTVMRSAAPGPAPMKWTVMARHRCLADGAGRRWRRRSRSAGRARRALRPAAGQRRRLGQRRRRRAGARSAAERVTTSRVACRQLRCRPTGEGTGRTAAAASRIAGSAGPVGRRGDGDQVAHERPRAAQGRGRSAPTISSAPRRRAGSRYRRSSGAGHGLVQAHCVTGMAGRQPCMPPTGSARSTAKRRRLAAPLLERREQRGLALQRHRVRDERPPGRRAAQAAASTPGAGDAAADEDRVGRRQARRGRPGAAP